MTPEEIQQAIEGMLRVQKELQESQIKLQQIQTQQAEEIQQMIEQGRERDRRIQQLTGYWISQGGDLLDIQMSLRNIYARLSKLEDENQ